MSEALVSVEEIRTATMRIAAIALAFSACTALAQQLALGTLPLTVTVEDQSHAPIPGARIVASARASGVRFEAISNGNGQAVIHLVQGGYDLKVLANGFRTWEDKDIEVIAEIKRTAILVVESHTGPVVIAEERPRIQLEDQPLSAEIPLIPLQQFIPPARLLRHRRHWF